MGIEKPQSERGQSLPKLRAFADFAQKRMRRDFRAGDYLPTVLP
jgi:hypothetical protein